MFHVLRERGPGLLVVGALFATCDTQQVSNMARQINDQINADSISKTPASGQFPPDATGGGNHLPFPAAGTRQRQAPNGAAVSMIEVRGWLVGTGTGCNPDPTDHDWHWELELDPAFAESKGMDVLELVRTGNVLLLASDFNDSSTPSPYSVVTRPIIHVELNAWDPAQHGGQSAPADWVSVPSPNCEGMSFPFDPRQPISFLPALANGQYVRMMGSLVTDDPHEKNPHLIYEDRLVGYVYHDDPGVVLNAARELWSAKRAETDPTNPVRWTELHPPDIVAVLDEHKARTETVRILAVAAETRLCAADSTICPSGTKSETRALDVDIPAPSAQPSPTATLHFTQKVSPETNCTTITEGDIPGCGATVTTLADRIHVHIRVTGKPNYGAPGKFKALYRVFWQ